MRFFCVLIILLASFNSRAQLNADSLWTIYEDETESDSVRLMAMWYYAYDLHMYSHPDSSVFYGHQMYEFAQEKKQLQFQAYACGTIGSGYYYLGELDSAVVYQEKALEVQLLLNNFTAAGSVYNNIANIQRERGHQAEALQNFNKALKIYERLDHKRGISVIMGNIAAVYDDLKDKENTKKWYQKALEANLQDDALNERSLLYTGIGSWHLTYGNIDSALYYQRKSLGIRKTIGNMNGIAMSHGHIGEIYEHRGLLDSAMWYFQESLVLLTALKSSSGVSDITMDIATIHFRNGNLEEALEFAKNSHDLASEKGFLDSRRDASFLLYQLYKTKGQFETALEMHEQYIMLRDSMTTVQNQKAIYKQEFQYTYQKKALSDSLKHIEDQRIVDLNHEQESEKQRLLIYGSILVIVLVTIFLFFVFNRLRITRKQKSLIEEQKIEVETQKEAVELVNNQLEEKSQEILDSITYAKRIQSAILPPQKLVKTYLPQSFVLYIPKDIVAGDFYWMETVGEKVLIAAADCTGHGVPGAMVSVVCNNSLNRSVREYGLKSPDEILEKTRELVIQEFDQSEEEVKDGMDIALCGLEKMKDGTSRLEYSGAHNPLWIIRNGASEIEEIKANKQPIGKFEMSTSFDKHTITLNEGDSFYIFSDGFADQFGGEKGKKFKSSNFKTLLLSLVTNSMDAQKEEVSEAFENWRGALEQLDDICVIGVRI